MRSAMAILALLALPLGSCQVVSMAHGDPLIELNLDTADPDPVPVQAQPWPLETRVDPQTGRFDLIWDLSDSEYGTQSIPIDAIYQVELARAYGVHPDELFVHLVNSRRILIGRGEQVSTLAAVLTTWLEKPVTELTPGVGHLDWPDPIDRPPPNLVVGVTGGMLNIQPLSDDIPDATSRAPDAISSNSSIEGAHTGHGRREDIDRTIKTHMTRFRSCYQRQLQRNPRLEGTVVMKITIETDGSVKEATVFESSLADPWVEKCIGDELLRLAFPPPSGGQIVVSYPFAFSRS